MQRRALQCTKVIWGVKNWDNCEVGLKIYENYQRWRDEEEEWRQKEKRKRREMEKNREGKGKETRKEERRKREKKIEVKDGWLLTDWNLSPLLGMNGLAMFFCASFSRYCRLIFTWSLYASPSRMRGKVSAKYPAWVAAFDLDPPTNISRLPFFDSLKVTSNGKLHAKTVLSIISWNRNWFSSIKNTKYWMLNESEKTEDWILHEDYHQKPGYKSRFRNWLFTKRKLKGPSKFNHMVNANLSV